MRGDTTLLLVHGSWHGTWCWDLLTPELDRLGIPWTAAALTSCGDDPAALGTIFDDAATVETAAASIDGDVVVLAHSYGGVVTTQAELPANVRHIVYLGAFVPDVGESLVDLLPPGPLPPFVVAHEDGSTTVAPDPAIDTFYHDCTPEVAGWAASMLRRHNNINNVTPVTRASWHTTPSSYVVLTEDHASPPPMQEHLATRCGARYDMATSHSPFLSRPEELADLIAKILA